MAAEGRAEVRAALVDRAGLVELADEVLLVEHRVVLGAGRLDRVGVVLGLGDPGLVLLYEVSAVLQLVKAVDVLDVEVGLSEGSELALFETVMFGLGGLRSCHQG